MAPGQVLNKRKEVLQYHFKYVSLSYTSLWHVSTISLISTYLYSNAWFFINLFMQGWIENCSWEWECWALPWIHWWVTMCPVPAQTWISRFNTCPVLRGDSVTNLTPEEAVWSEHQSCKNIAIHWNVTKSSKYAETSLLSNANFSQSFNRTFHFLAALINCCSHKWTFCTISVTRKWSSIKKLVQNKS